MRKIALSLSMTFLGLNLLTGCYSEEIKWNPNFHINSSHLMGIVAEDGHYVSCSDEAFNEYASLHKDKIKELAEILKRARLPKEIEKRKEFIVNLLEDTNHKLAKPNL